MRIQEVMDDLKDFLTSMDRRMQVIHFTTAYTGAASLGGGSGQNLAQQIMRDYHRDFVEMHKALTVRGSDIFKWFSAYSMQPTKQALSMRELASAIQSMSLSRQLTDTDFFNMTKAMNPTQTGLVDIAEIDRVIRQAINGVPNGQLQEDIIENVIRAFNGDMDFVRRELIKADLQGRGLIDTNSFAETLRINAPPTVNFPTNDIMFLILKYPSAAQQQKIDLNLFMDDFRRVMQKKSITPGIYNQQAAAL